MIVYEWIVSTTIDNETDIHVYCETDYETACIKAYKEYADITSESMVEPCDGYKLATSLKEFMNSPEHILYWGETDYADHVVFYFHSFRA